MALGGIDFSDTMKAYRSPGIRNLPGPIKQNFTRALQLLGHRQSEWVLAMVRQTIADAKTRFGPDLFFALNPDETAVMATITTGASELQQIIDETGITQPRIDAILAQLVESGHLRKVKRGRTAGQRGAQVDLWLVVEK